MRKLIVSLVITSLLQSFSASAACPKPVQFLKKGQATPCEGYLFSKEKELEVRIAVEESKVDKKQLKLKDLSIKALNESLELSDKIANKEREKAELWRTRAVDITKEYTKSKKNSTIKSIALILAGVGLTLGSAWAVKQVGR